MIPAPTDQQDTGTIALVTIFIATAILFVLTMVSLGEMRNYFLTCPNVQKGNFLFFLICTSDGKNELQA